MNARRKALWYWLVPGVHVKRYIVLFVASLILCVAAGAGLLAHHGSPPGTQILLGLERLLQTFLSPGATSAAVTIALIILVVLSLVLMAWALALMVRSVVMAVARPAPHEPLSRMVYRFWKAESLPRVAVIGGGTGIRPVIESLRTENVKLTTIVTMADSGGSTGRLRETMGVLPPGDFRNALIATAGESTRSARLLGYRFPDDVEGIGGHNMGNLMIAALAGIKGNFGDAVQELADILQLPGRVLPMSLDDISLRAHFTDGTTVDGEDQIPLQRKTIDSIEVLPSHAKPFVPALEALSHADCIIIGPGSLFTSLIPPLSIEATADTIARSSATKVLVVNAMTERGETDGYTAGMFLHKVEEVLGRSCIDVVVLSTTPIPAETLQRYAASGVNPVPDDLPRRTHPRVVEADVCSTANGMVRHDPDKLRALFRSLLGL